MPFMAATFKVKDYELWRKNFDEGAVTRINHGLISELVFRGERDRNEIVLVQRWHDVEKVRDMFKSHAMKKRMQETGIEGGPEFFIETEEKVRA